MADNSWNKVCRHCKRPGSEYPPADYTGPGCPAWVLCKECTYVVVEIRAHLRHVDRLEALLSQHQPVCYDAECSMCGWLRSFIAQHRTAHQRLCGLHTQRRTVT